MCVNQENWFQWQYVIVTKITICRVKFEIQFMAPSPPWDEGTIKHTSSPPHPVLMPSSHPHPRIDAVDWTNKQVYLEVNDSATKHTNQSRWAG
jgi:hypothetical protein